MDEIAEGTAPVEDGQATEATTEATEATETPATPTPQQIEDELQRQYEIKVNGSSKKLPLSEILKKASLSEGAYSKFEEAAQIRKETQEFVEFLKKDPIEALRLLGVDPRGISEGYLKKVYEREALDPKERELLETKEQLEALKKEREDAAKAKEETTKQEEVRLAQEKLEKDFIDALEKTPEVPATPHTISRMAYWAERAESAGIKWDTEMLIDRVKSEYEELDNQRLKSLKPEDIIAKLGPDGLKAIQAHLAAQVRNPVTAKKTEQKPKKPVSEYDEW